MKGRTKAELDSDNRRLSEENSVMSLALMFVAGGIEPDAVERFNVGDPGERESYTLSLYGATRADGGTVVQVRRFSHKPSEAPAVQGRMSKPDVSVYRLDVLSESCPRHAAGYPSDLNVKRRDAVAKLRTARGILFALADEQRTTYVSANAIGRGHGNGT